MSRYDSRASSLAGLPEIAAGIGADLPALLRAEGLDPALLNRPDERIGFDRICALFERCAADWDMPDFGLRLAPYQHLEVLGPVALVTRMSRDLRSALLAMIDNLVVHTSGVVASLDETGSTASLALEARPADLASGQHMLAAMGMARNVLEQASGQALPLIEVQFRQPEGRLRVPAAGFFRCPVRFGAERNALVFDRAALDRKLDQSDTAYHAIIARYLTVRRHEETGSIVEAARGEIARQMEFGTATLDSVARRLRTEPRGLQRRLALLGTHFRDLVDDWRSERARQLVAHTTLPLAEVSLALGYTDQSTFSRAYRRWYGVTPRAARHEAA